MDRYNFSKIYWTKIRKDIFERVIKLFLEATNKKLDDFHIRIQYGVDDNGKRVEKQDCSFEEFMENFNRSIDGYVYFQIKKINNYENIFGISYRIDNNKVKSTSIYFYEKDFHVFNNLKKKLNHILKEDHHFKEVKSGPHIRQKLDKFFKKNNSFMTIGAIMILILTLLASLGIIGK